MIKATDTKLISLAIGLAGATIGLVCVVLALVIATGSANSTIRSQIDDVEDELRAEMRESHRELRAEMREGNRELKAAMEAGHSEIREEIASVRAEIASVPPEVRSETPHPSADEESSEVDPAIAALFLVCLFIWICTLLEVG